MSDINYFIVIYAQKFQCTLLIIFKAIFWHTLHGPFPLSGGFKYVIGLATDVVGLSRNVS